MNSRHCPICGDEIPDTAHRLKKLCGKKECLLEQQRISSRKSYHKVLGHTEPEKRSCVVCTADITHLRGNRVVCEKPTCKTEIKRRSGYAYFERNSGNPVAKEKNRLNQQKYRAAKRKCRICRDDISHLPLTATICEKQSCEEYLQRLRSSKGVTTKASDLSLRPPKIKAPRVVRQPLNKNYQRVPTAASRKPIVRPKPAPVPKRVIKEDDTPWTPTVRLPEAAPTYGGMTMKSYSFDDPWNCQACREANHLCRLHQRMDDDGDRPPTVRATSTIIK